MLLQGGDGQLNGTVAAAAGGEDGFKALQGNVQPDLNAVVDGKGADTAHRMTDQLRCLLMGEHFCLYVELGLEFSIVDLSITSGDHQYRLVLYHEG